VLDGLEELHVESPEACELLCVGVVIFAAVPVDELQLAAVGDDDLVSEGLEEVRDPAGMGSDFDDDASPVSMLEELGEASRSRPDPSALDDVSGAVDRTNRAVAVPEVTSNGHRG